MIPRGEPTESINAQLLIAMLSQPQTVVVSGGSDSSTALVWWRKGDGANAYIDAIGNHWRILW